MKQILSVASIIVSILATSHSVHAMDARTTNIPWAGYYIGGNLGAAFGGLKNTLSVVNTSPNPLFHQPAIPNINASGSKTLTSSQFSGGAQLGYNKPVLSNLLLGFEVSYDYINLHESSGGIFAYTANSKHYYSLFTCAKLHHIGTLRPRLGYIHKKFLPYVTGGSAVSKLTYRQVFTDLQHLVVHPIPFDKTIWGWTAGGGLEYAAFDRYSFKIEYLYSGFRDRSAHRPLITTGRLAGLSANLDNTLHTIHVQTVLFGISAHFA
ncbi:outer membrane protein [Legionella maceachernii]|uniref:Outer membrane protein beta-barrel domain-containing protein n=1 Tax=Legionella maceachernii TaxID=466 RepID=A0A0W0VWG2_9GAMM|nr:outer membrane beta-barrel protein [Legionella maceachernii]KTD24660.1 hypothetical protein Lmac_2747 [Legionella maceachernii]SKA26688.1 outer membrane immunogenic protein [Legionella maceachernii]SUP01848.1 Opacity protein and related surface antigens [Legionella maceachernii]